MAYSAPSTQVYGALVDQNDWNELVNNDLHFAEPPLASLNYKPGTDISITSTSFVNADATNLSLSITSQRGKKVHAVAGFYGSNTAPGNAYFDLALDSVRAGNATNGIAIIEANSRGHCFIRAQWTGISAGAHTIRLQLKTDNASYAALLKANSPVHMIAWE